MATTKKSTKAKTKTASAKAAKTTKKTVSKKVSAKVTTKSASTNVRSRSQQGATSVLTRLQIISAAVSLVLAAVAAFLMNNHSFELVSGLLAKNELAAGTGTVLVPAINHVYDLPLRWSLVVILTLSAVVPLLLLTTYKARYAAALKSKVHTLRWIEIGVTSALMLEIIALLSGVNDIITLKVIAGLAVVTSALGWVAEKRNVQAGRPVKSEMFISIATGALPWLLIGGFAAGTYIHGRIISPWYVYALYAAVLAGSIGYCLTLKAAVMRKVTDYNILERNYVVTNILVKTAFAVILIVGFSK